MKTKIEIALFASGSGTNVENIFHFFKKNENIEVSCVLCNKPDAYVITRCKTLNLACLVINRQNFANSDHIIDYLEHKNVDLIVLAGFLWLIPTSLINYFPNKIINIHPALLPKYGGKGMYGSAVHNAVFENKESETGITIHLVNKNYDEGSILFQKSVKLDANDDANSIADKVHMLEYKYYPIIIEKFALNL